MAVPPAVLSDEHDDERLRADGYTALSTPLLDPLSAAELRELFGRVHGWGTRGWYNAFNDGDLVTRRVLDRELRDHLLEPVRARFTGFEPFFFTYLVKWPGAERDANFLFLHQDWMYVDESHGDRSFVVFLALEDITESNGRLHMLPGGHHLSGGIRGSRLIAPWLCHDGLLRSEMVPLPLEVGHAAVWDGAIVHCSEVNRSPMPRAAVGVWMRPRTKHLVHYRRLDDRLAARHDISEEFFAQQTPTTLDERLSQRAPDAVVDIGAEPLDVAELSRRLQRTTELTSEAQKKT